MRVTALLPPTRLFVLLASVGIVHSQTAPSFEPASSTNLVVEYGSSEVHPAGEFLSEAATQKAPTLGTDDALKGSYLAIMVDPDAGTEGGPSISVLQWLQTDLTSDNTSSKSSFVPLKAKQQAMSAPYSGPAIPPESNFRPHRYTFLLFSQPDDFDLPSNYSSFLALNPGNLTNRYPFDVGNFSKAAGLGNPVAANYFRCQAPNSTSSTSASVATSSSSPSVAAATSMATITSSPTTAMAQTPSPTPNMAACKISKRTIGAAVGGTILSTLSATYPFAR